MVKSVIIYDCSTSNKTKFLKTLTLNLKNNINICVYGSSICDMEMMKYSKNHLILNRNRDNKEKKVFGNISV